MDRTEAAELKNLQGRMVRSPGVPVLPWESLLQVAEEDARASFAWTPETEAAFLRLIAQGFSVSDITNQDRPGWPTFSDYRKKSGQDPDFVAKIEIASLERADSLVDKAVNVAEIVTESTQKSAKLKIETAFRMASILHPKKYGQRQQTELSGSLVLAAGSLAELAAAASSRKVSCAAGNTEAIERSTTGTLCPPPPLNNVPSVAEPQQIGALEPSGDVP